MLKCVLSVELPENIHSSLKSLYEENMDESSAWLSLLQYEEFVILLLPSLQSLQARAIIPPSSLPLSLYLHLTPSLYAKWLLFE